MHKFAWVRFRPREESLYQCVPLQIINRYKGLLLDKPVNPNPTGRLCPPLLASLIFMFRTYEENRQSTLHPLGDQP
jgi:hypothetical protein